MRDFLHSACANRHRILHAYNFLFVLMKVSGETSVSHSEWQLI